MLDDLDLTEVEAELCRLPEVQVARIVDDGDRLTEVHVVATPAKQPKHVVRDVQSVALATFGLEIDHRIVSVVQLGQNGDSGTRTEEYDPSIDRRPRVGLGGVTLTTSGVSATANVSLSLGDTEANGQAEGSSATTSRHRLVARAAVEALRALNPEAAAVDVDHATTTRVGSSDVAVVTLVFVVPPSEYTVAGSAIVRSGNDGDAVARAVLDATNRRLPHL